MTCRHSDPINNPGCSSYRTPEQQVADLNKRLEATKAKFRITDEPLSQKYDVLKVVQVSDYLVMRVKYESCENCTYEGEKIMVFKAHLVDALR